jgi:hypothetical protein
LIDIAFKLEPVVDQIMIDFKESDKLKYAKEHVECDIFYEDVVVKDKEKF